MPIGYLCFLFEFFAFLFSHRGAYICDTEAMVNARNLYDDYSSYKELNRRSYAVPFCITGPEHLLRVS